MIENTNKGLSGSTLKIIAIVSMLIDHAGAIIVEGKLYNLDYPNETMKIILNISLAMRLIGRIAFPIFCYLLVEGFLHTKNIKKYAARMFIFALISEIPFDLAFFQKIFAWQYQNVFFTLFIGVMVMYGIDFSRKRFSQNNLASSLAGFAVIISGMLLAEFISCDYSSLGVIVIVILYLFHEKKALGFTAISLIFILYCISPGVSMYNTLKSYVYIETDFYQFIWYMVGAMLQAFAGIAFIPISFYNGKKGLSLKYFFYAFYPVHILILAIIANYIM